MNDEQRHYTETYLVQVLEDKIAKNEPEWVLDSYLQPCETYGCVAGDAAIRMQGDGVEIPNLFGGPWFDIKNSELEVYSWSLSDCFDEIFGFTKFFNDGESSVFGESFQGSLQHRLDYVNSQLEANS